MNKHVVRLLPFLLAAGLLAPAGEPALRIALQPHPDGSVELQWSGMNTSHVATVQSTGTNPEGPWADAPGVWPTEATSHTVAGPAEILRMYRLWMEQRWDPPIALGDLRDLDEDGLSKALEEALGLDPNNPDTDGDGLLDGYEALSRYDPDPGISGLELDPGMPDSNMDGIDDASELFAHFHPDIDLPDTGMLDSDGEGLTDRFEALWGTRPDLRDTDADGAEDDVEVAMGTDPTDGSAAPGITDDPDGGDPMYYLLKYGPPEQIHYLADDTLIGFVDFDTLGMLYGFIGEGPPGPKPAPGVDKSEKASPKGPPPRNPPVGTGEGGRDIYIAYVAEIDGKSAVRVPPELCPSGWMFLCPEVMNESEAVSVPGEERPRTMRTVKPVQEIAEIFRQNPRLQQQCCVPGPVTENETMGFLIDLFKNDLEMVRLLTRYALTHGLFIFDIDDANRLYATRDKFVACCGLDIATASAMATFIMVVANADEIAIDMILGLTPLTGKLNDVITAVDRGLLNSWIGDKKKGLVDDDAVTQFLCSLYVKYFCMEHLRARAAQLGFWPPGCPQPDDVAFGGIDGAGEDTGGDDGNEGGEETGHSVPVDYGQGQDPAENPDGNKPPPGGAGENEASDDPEAPKKGANKGDGNGPSGKGGRAGPGRKGGGGDGPPPGDPTKLPVPGIPPEDPPPTGFWQREFGDAPDRGITAGYPAPDDAVIGAFPTVKLTTNSRVGYPGGHIRAPGHVWLGRRYSRERDAVAPALEEDPEFNLDPARNWSNRDYFDDGLVLPVRANPCGLTGVHITINSWTNSGPQDTVYANLLIDFDRSGTWRGKVESAREWAVINFPVELEPGREQLIALPPFQTPCTPFPAWARLVLSDQPVPADVFDPGGDGWDGSGAFNYGEVEDYLIE